MEAQKKFFFMIYQKGCEGRLAVIQRDRFLRERAFLDQLIGRASKHNTFNRIVPDPVAFDPSDERMGIKLDQQILASKDYYPLDDAQFAAYLTFRRKMDAEFGKPE